MMYCLDFERLTLELAIYWLPGGGGGGGGG